MYRCGKAIHLSRREDKAFKQVLGMPQSEHVFCHAQRALLQPLQNQAHIVGSVPRECLSDNRLYPTISR